MTNPWFLKPRLLIVATDSGVVASTFCALTFPGNSVSNPLTAGLICAQTGQPGRK